MREYTFIYEVWLGEELIGIGFRAYVRRLLNLPSCYNFPSDSWVAVVYYQDSRYKIIKKPCQNKK